MAASTASTAGSPPHAWGHLGHGRSSILGVRFTPTRVGTSGSPPPTRATRPVHPHTRGDIPGPVRPASAPGGSPPHAWGHLDMVTAHLNYPRFTPTRVGTSSHSIHIHSQSSVHPHTRGDISWTSVFAPSCTGSPPHAWGHRIPERAEGVVNWFTPTRVGTSRCAASPAISPAVHPHTRGDI